MFWFWVWFIVVFALLLVSVAFWQLDRWRLDDARAEIRSLATQNTLLQQDLALVKSRYRDARSDAVVLQRELADIHAIAARHVPDPNLAREIEK